MLMDNHFDGTVEPSEKGSVSVRVEKEKIVMAGMWQGSMIISICRTCLSVLDVLLTVKLSIRV